MVCFLLRDGEADRDEWRKPGGGVPFQDRWRYRDCLVSGPEMVVILPGAFLMGSPPDEPGRDECEGPQHRVTIQRAFALSRFAVTFDEWDLAQTDRDWRDITGRTPREPDDGSWPRGNRPAIDVSWDDAQAFAAWVRMRTGREYRLPSEAEWEYACRAGAATPFWWGSTVTMAQANYAGTEVYEGGGEKGEYRGRTLPVNHFAPNAFGLYQMQGNVSEWVEDRWHDAYDGAPDDGSAWTDGDDPRRVRRGGSWFTPPRSLRSAARIGSRPDTRLISIGFRLARTLF
jgi:formylglycine-generating enzyme required for sulfatase activity